MDDIHKVVQAAANEASKQSETQRQAQTCLEAWHTMRGSDNRNSTMRTNRSDGRLTEYDAICVFRNARLLAYEFSR